MYDRHQFGLCSNREPRTLRESLSAYSKRCCYKCLIACPNLDGELPRLDRPGLFYGPYCELLGLNGYGH